MKKFVLLLIVVLAMAVGYLKGTEQGRRQGVMLMEALERLRGGDEEPASSPDATIDLADESSDAGAAADEADETAEETQPA